MLSGEALVTGAKLALENAVRLFFDAFILHQNGRYPSAITLGVLAAEELGKSIILAKKKVKNEPLSTREWKRIMERHTPKLAALAENLDLVPPGMFPPSSARALSESARASAKSLHIQRLRARELTMS